MGFRYVVNDRTYFCWSTKRGSNGKFQAWKQIASRRAGGLAHTGKRHYFKRRSSAKAWALKCRDTAERRSRERRNLNSENIAVKTTAMLDKAKRMRDRGEADRAAKLELQAHALKAELHAQEQQRASDIESEKVALLAKLDGAPDHLWHAINDAAGNIATKRVDERRNARLVKAREDLKRWQRKLKLAQTKVRKLTKKIKRMEKAQ